MPHPLHLLTCITGTLLLATATLAAAAPGCTGAPLVQEADLPAIQAHVRATGKQVLTFEGDSGAGYQDPAAMLALAGRILAAESPARVLVNIGSGDVARDELLAARALGKPVQVHPAHMDHALARAKAQRRGAPPPVDFRGTAHPALAPG